MDIVRCRWMGYIKHNVADPGCLSRILIFIHPGSNKSTKRGGKFYCPTIFCYHKYHKIVNNLIFEQTKKIFSAKTLRIIVLLPQNLSLSY